MLGGKPEAKSDVGVEESKLKFIKSKEVERLWTRRVSF